MSNTITTAVGKTLTVKRTLNAPRELVWETWTKPEHIVQWWGPVGFTTTSQQMDVKTGGTWRFIMHGPDGRDYLNKIIFIEVVKPERLTYKHAGDDETEPVSFHVTVTFEAAGNKTNLTMHSIFESAEELDRLNREYGAIQGATDTMNRLGEYIINMKIQPIVIERTYNATIDKVWNAITNKEAMKKWYFDIAAFKPEVGFEFQFHGKGKEGEDYLHLCKITEVVKEKKLKHSWRYDGYEGISYVSFELFEEGDKTRVKLTHEGLETFPVTATNAFAKENFMEGWTYLIGTGLKEFVEK